MSLEQISTVPSSLQGLDPAGHVARAIATSAPTDNKKISCSKEISIGIFFDGTSNNKLRDQESNSHSNIVVLFDAHKDNKMGDYYSYYIPGVGTKFPEIGEMGELAEGKSQAVGGEARIHYAMIKEYYL